MTLHTIAFLRLLLVQERQRVEKMFPMTTYPVKTSMEVTMSHMNMNQLIAEATQRLEEIKRASDELEELTTCE